MVKITFRKTSAAVLLQFFKLNCFINFIVSFVDYIARYGRMAEQAARRKFWQILSAVEYCHERRIVHRDLKVKYYML